MAEMDSIPSGERDGLVPLAGRNLREVPGRAPGGQVTKSLSDFAHERLLEMLLSGKLVAGATLQERRLAEELAISRTPVREALNQLEAEGLVAKTGRLMTVCQISVQAFMETLNVRKLMEVEAAGLAAGKRIDKILVETIRAAIWRLMETQSPTPGEHWAVDDMVHGAISQAAGNTLLAKMIRDLRRQTHIFNTRRIPERLRPGCLEHLALIDAVAAGDQAKSRRLMAEHIDNVKAAIVDELISGRTAA